MKSIYKVEFSDEAISGFENIIYYIESNFSFKAAQKFVIKFDETVHLISTNPNTFPKISEIGNVRRALVAKLTSIYYGVDDDRQIVNVFFVKDNRQQQPMFS